MGPDDPRGKLLSLAVHELRAPMSIVSGYVRMLLREVAGPLPEPQRKLLEETERSCSRLSALIAELSDISNLDAGTATFNRGRMHLFALVEQLVTELRAGTDPAIQVEVSAPPADVTLDGDAVRLRQAFTAISRAIRREIPDDERLLIECRRDPAAARLTFGTSAAVAALSETPIDVLEVFDESRGGLGLALPVARRVIEHHGGRVYTPTGIHAKTGVVVVLPVQQ
jgi:signal transduction histidine kinase